MTAGGSGARPASQDRVRDPPDAAGAPPAGAETSWAAAPEAADDIHYRCSRCNGDFID